MFKEIKMGIPTIPSAADVTDTTLSRKARAANGPSYKSWLFLVSTVLKRMVKQGSDVCRAMLLQRRMLRAASMTVLQKGKPGHQRLERRRKAVLPGKLSCKRPTLNLRGKRVAKNEGWVVLTRPDVIGSFVLEDQLAIGVFTSPE